MIQREKYFTHSDSTELWSARVDIHHSIDFLIKSRIKIITPIRAYAFFPTFKNSPKIEFFEFCFEIGFKLTFKLSSCNIKKEKNSILFH